MSTIGQDIQSAFRRFAHRPLFAVVVIATLALGIGANTAIFSIVNALLLAPLPLPEADRLVAIRGLDRDGRGTYPSFPDFQDLRRDARSYTAMTAFVPQSVNLTGRAEPQRIRGGFVSESFFDVVGVRPAVGRGFRSGEDEIGAEGVCVLNHDAWQRVFGGDSSIVGRTIVLNNAPFTVVGIMPAGFRFPFDEVEVWIPHHHWPPFAPNYQNRAAPLVGPIARLGDGVSLEEARAELAAIAARLARDYPEAGEGRTLAARRLREVLVQDMESAALVLLGAVSLVLLIASANVANLMLAQTASRMREIATRAALGAGRGRIVRQLLTETMALWTLGGIAGVGVGWWTLDALTAAAPLTLPGGLEARLDATVLAYTLAVTAVTGFVFGLLPALRFSRPDVADALKEGGRGGEAAAPTRLRSSLTVAQLAVSLVLLAGAGLMLRSFGRLTQVDLGFRAEGLLTMEYRLPRNKYPEGAQQAEFHRRVVERVRQLPGVRAATVVRALPLSGNGESVAFELPDRPRPSGGAALRTLLNAVDPWSFETLGVPLLRGRAFESHDHAKARPVAVVNRHMAERFWPGQDPVGRAVRLPETTVTIVGVVGDVKQYAADDQPQPQVYVPQEQLPNIFNTLAVRTEGDPMAQSVAVIGALRSVDRDQPVWKVRTLDSLVESSLGLHRFLMQLMAAYSLLALLLAALGLYGVVAHAVASRRHEIGIRMALGARSRDVLSLVLSRGLKLAGVGVVAGIVGALALGRVMKSILYDVSPADPLTLAVVALLLVLVAGLASYLPARRAARIDPMRALRYH
jgi:predicted permease